MEIYDPKMPYFYVPRKRVAPFRIIPPAKEGEQPIIVPDFGCLDNHQFDDIVAKVKEQRGKPPKRYRDPSIITIETIASKNTKQPVRYIITKRPA